MSDGLAARRDASAWGLPSVVAYFERHRTTTSDVYPSEWHFLKDCLREGMSVLDVGCALGGFATILAEHLRAFSYTGVDVNEEMVRRARLLHPEHTFRLVSEGDFSPVGDTTFDLVLVLGILHLHEGWRETLRGAWARTRACLVFDLRLTEGESIEDRSRSYMRMDFGGNPEDGSTSVPYIIMNDLEARTFIDEVCADARTIQSFGYQHVVTPSATTPLERVSAVSWRVER